MIAALLLAAATLATPDLTCRVRSKDGHLVRSRSRVCTFLRMAGHLAPGQTCRVPAGMRVDHTISLACGGCDLPSNMQLLTIDEWKAKTSWERRPCSAWWDGTNARALQKGR
jgi:hypothetical protein